MENFDTELRYKQKLSLSKMQRYKSKQLNVAIYHLNVINPVKTIFK